MSEEVHSIYKHWNQKLMRAIIEADDLYENDQPIDSAKERLDEYIRTCPVDSLRENAERAYKGYSEKRYKKTDPEHSKWCEKVGRAIALEVSIMKTKKIGADIDKDLKEKSLLLLDEVIQDCPFDSLKADAIKTKNRITNL